MLDGMNHNGRPRIAIAGIASESSTFSPHRTELDDFTVTRSEQVFGRYPWMTDLQGWAAGADWLPALHARALPGGPVTSDAYAALKAELLRRLRDVGRLDGVFLDLHGALSVVGYRDVETDLVRAVRDVVGPDALLSASMDLHGNVSRELASLLDLITCFRMAPHEDAAETRERAARNLFDRLMSGGGRPVKAWVPIPVLLPGEKTSTRIEPARSLYARVARVAETAGIIDAALWVGYAWADEPRCHATVVVTGDDTSAVTTAARQLAAAYWDARADFEFVAPTADMDECLRRALASDRRPFLISDSGDNPTAGGAGDVSFGLSRLLAAPELLSGTASAIYASVVDPAAVIRMCHAGRGATVSVELSGHIDRTPPGPVAVTGTVASTAPEDPVGGDIAVLTVGGVNVIVTSRRKPYHHIADFTALDLDPTRSDVVVVKIGYLEPELYEIAADWLLALTPGGVDQDLRRLGHHNLGRPTFPFDADKSEPSLEPELL